MAEYKQCSYSLPIKQAKCQYREKESQFKGSDMRRMWQGLQTIRDYKRKTFFARFEDNTVPPTRPATKDCGLSFSVADVSKTRRPVPTASLAASSEHAKTSWLVCLRRYLNSPYPSLLSPHASRWPPFVPVPKNGKVTELNG